MSEHTQGNPDLLYGLHDRPAPAKAFLGASQHVLASFVGIITPFQKSYSNLANIDY